MANIPEYNLPLGQSGLQPSTGGAEAFERAGMETQRAARVTEETGRELGNSIAQGYAKLGQFVKGAGGLVDDYLTQKDIASAAQQHTALAAQAAKDLPGIIANAADPVKAVQDYYENTYQPAIEKINGGMITKRSRMWSVEHSQSGAQAFMHTGIAEAMNVQGERAITGFNKSMDNLSDAARADPHGLDNYIKQVDSLIDGTKSALSPTQQVHIEGMREKMKEQVAIAAGHALAEQNPAQFVQDLQNGWGKGVITEQNRQLLTHYATYVTRQKKLQAARTSSDITTDWASNGPGGIGPDGKPTQPTWTPEGIGWMANNPAISAEDRQAAARLGAIGNQVMIWKKAHFNTRHPAPHGNMGDEYMLEQGIKDGKVTIGDIADGMQRYLQTHGQYGISDTTAARLMGKLKPEKVEKYSAIHSDPVLKSAREQAEELIEQQGQMMYKGAFNSGNPAVRARIRQFRMDVDNTLEGAMDRKEDWKQYIDPSNPKYLFTPDKLRQYVPTKPEITGQMLYNPQAEKFAKEHPMGGMFSNAERPAPPKPPVKESPKKFFPYLFNGGGSEEKK